ncbi:MAG: asparagine synthase (glutamine-hydrolyzing) [Pseudomonadota bacterium]
MCGITGFLGKNLTAESLNVIQKMNATVQHRGPNDSGFWHNEQNSIFLGHQRLSIVDLSPAGHQPMVSSSERFVIVFNGEIYNHTMLRKELTCVWRGTSDTETLLAGIDAWGIENTLRKCIGMFAFAVWDKHENKLTLARDRLGEKPLYYGWQNNIFIFGSELKALRAHSAFVGNINRDAIALQLRYNYIPTPHSIYKGIFKLIPGTTLTIPIDCPKDFLPKPIVYWSLKEIAEQGQNNLFNGSDAEAIALLDSQLRDSIAQQMIADVPLGAFLSGGIDSSTVVALMQVQSKQPIRTFSIGFHEANYNEAQHAAAVARHLGTQHTELYVTPQQAMDVIPRLASLYDEPFADSSQIPTFLVSQMTRQHVTVSLSGDAGDELFAGYNRYLLTSAIWRKVGKLPSTARHILSRFLLSISPNKWAQVLNSMDFLLPKRARFSQPGDKLHKFAEILNVDSPEAIYHKLVSQWKNPEEIVLGAKEPVTIHTSNEFSHLKNLEQRMMALDTLSYLPDDILTKVDRAAMGVSLETRVPFLDHRVVELAWRLPMHLKIRNGQSKWILRQVLYKYVPKTLIERPKMGFGVPIDTWLRGPLREWAEHLLNESRLKQEGYLNAAPIRKKWDEHLSGQRNWQYQLWNVLMFQAWLEENRT